MIKSYFSAPLTVIATSIVSLAVGEAAQAASFIIDDFNTSSMAETSLPNDTNSDTSNPNVLDSFTSRDITVTTTQNDNNNDSRIQSTGTFLDITKGTATLATFEADYTGGTIDFSNGGVNSFFRIAILENNAPSTPTGTSFVLEVTDSDGTVGTLTDSDIPFVVSGFPINRDLMFSDFSNFADLNFMEITDFSFTVNSNSTGNGADLSIDFISTDMPPTVPEPGTLLGLAAFGLAGLAGRRLKK